MSGGPYLVDFFCGAGGASVGYSRAGFDVTMGVDIEPQPNYPFPFEQGDAIEHLRVIVDGGWNAATPFAIHASPPCQTHVKGLAAVNAGLGREMRHRDYIAEVRELLIATGLPYVIENVEGAPLRDPVRLCGTSFGLPLRRHRLFESNVPLLVPPCAHGQFRTARYWTSWRPNGEKRRATTVQVYGNGGETHEWGPAMGIDWMTPSEMAEAIPPIFTETIGRQLSTFIERKAA